jgi:simple sugar transport system permease protein
MEAILLSVAVRTLVAGTPLLLGTLGEVLAERSGVLNLGVEGMMAIGAVTGYLAALVSGSPWAGLAAAVAAGTLISSVHAFVSVTLKANQVVSGLSLSMLGLGMASLFGKPYIGQPLPVKLEVLRVPLLADIPVLGPVLFARDPVFYLSVLLGLIFWFLVGRTRWGIEVRSVGENPAAADAAGLSVNGLRYLCTLLGGALAGLAGAYLSLAYSNSWMDGMTAGRGWIVIALTIFALWRPARAFLGAYLFGVIFVLQYLLQPLGIPPNLLGMMPYLATLAVLVIGGLRADHRHLAAPAALGEPFSKS